MALAAFASGLLAVVYLKSFGDPVSLFVQIATVIGVFLTVLVGAALMSLVFLSSRSGHDDDATFGEWNDERRDG